MGVDAVRVLLGPWQATILRGGRRRACGPPRQERTTARRGPSRESANTHGPHFPLQSRTR